MTEPHLPDLDHQIHGHFCLDLRTGEIEYSKYDHETFKHVKIDIKEYAESFKNESSVVKNHPVCLDCIREQFFCLVCRQQGDKICLK